jgi:hypothetical protein
MIIVVEGVSAAGKTTWCRANARDCLVAETFPADRHAQATEGRATAQYWTDWNAKRWADALSMESLKGLSVCDTDPLKLHYPWSLWQVGELPESQWIFQLEATRQAIANRKLGFADLYIVKQIDPGIARQQRDNDVGRPRGRFELHIQLQRPLIRWYQALATVLGGNVIWRLPDDISSMESVIVSDFRYSLEKFDKFVDSIRC